MAGDLPDRQSVSWSMSALAARRAVVLFSLVSTGVLIPFLILAPYIGYPLKPTESLAVVRVITPVFLGFLGAASIFVTKINQEISDIRGDSGRLLGFLIFGPFLLFFISMVSLLLAFYLGNSPHQTVVGIGMSVDDLTSWISIILGILTVTVGVISNSLFGMERHDNSTGQENPK